jgi:mandelamide amidase
MPLTMNKFDQVGPLTRSVADLALFDSAVTGETSPLSATPLSNVRIGISPEYFLSGLDPEVDRITSEAFLKLRAAGATLVWAEIPEAAKAAMGVVITMITYETMPAMSGYLEQHGTGLSFEQMLEQCSEGMQQTLKAFALPPNRPTREVYESMLAKRQEIREEIRNYFERQGITALAFPPVMIPPPRIGEEAEVNISGETVPLYIAMARNTALGSCASMASLILPAGMTLSGLPVGLEFDALEGNDRALLSLGLSLEKALGPIPAPDV